MMDKSTPISIFAYNFPHKKTQDFIFRILAEGYEISVIYAANPVILNIPPSSVKSKINHIGLIHPEQIAKRFRIRYLVAGHNSEELKTDARANSSLAVISGARILKAEVIDCFPKGIINFHPGIIPYARGLDALFWSVYNNHPLGVTAHLIDKHIDAGKILSIGQMKINSNDTVLDLSERLYELQLDMLPNAINKALGDSGYLLDDYGTYNGKMESELEKKVIEMLPQYVKANSNA
jgi:phosphoribosylglycinamide formyltransferase-1